MNKWFIWESLCQSVHLLLHPGVFSQFTGSIWWTVMMNWMNGLHSLWFMTVLEEVSLLNVLELVYWRCRWCWGKTSSPGCKYWWMADVYAQDFDSGNYFWLKTLWLIGVMLVNDAWWNGKLYSRCPISWSNSDIPPQSKKPKNPKFGIKNGFYHETI